MQACPPCRLIRRACFAGKLANKVPTAGGSVQASPDEIAFEHAKVITPAGAALVQDLTLRVQAGTNLLVTGPNGSGKSSLFRVLGGLWPLTEGVVRKPGGAEGGLAHDIFYVPQRPYVTIGTLQDQLIYPLTRTGANAAAAAHWHVLAHACMHDGFLHAAPLTCRQYMQQSLADRQAASPPLPLLQELR